MKSDISPSRRHLHVPSFERQTDRTRRTTDSALHALTSTDTDTHLVALRPPPSTLCSPPSLTLTAPPLLSSSSSARASTRAVLHDNDTRPRAFLCLRHLPVRPPACLSACLVRQQSASSWLASSKLSSLRRLQAYQTTPHRTVAPRNYGCTYTH